MSVNKIDETIAMVQNNQLKKSDTFRFRCRKCGQSCKNREDIILNPYDLYRAAKALNMKHEDFIEKYCEVYIGPSSKLPLIRLMPVGTEKICPLLKDNHCSVHQSKPTVCALFPLGRSVDVQTDKKSIIYFYNGATCGKKSDKHTVAEWLKSFGLEKSEEFFIEWADFSGEIAIKIHDFKKKVSEKTMNATYRAVYIYLYLKYDEGKDFMDAFRENCKNCIDMLKEVNEAMDTYNEKENKTS